MTDRELLEAAARVAGSDVFGEPGCYFRRCASDAVTGWNPLEDGGYALRLAAKLNLVVDFFEGEVISANKVVKFDVNDIASARRAIVRAAASMSPDLAAGGREGVR